MIALPIPDDILERGEQTHPALEAPNTDTQMKVRPMALKDIWPTSKTWINAFRDDPTTEYMRADAVSFLETWYGRYVLCACLALWWKCKIMFTVDGAASSCSGDSPVPKTPFNAHREQFAIFILRLARGKATLEQDRVNLNLRIPLLFGTLTLFERSRERDVKHGAALSRAIPPGERENMYYLEEIATDPAQQGRGLGSAVLRAFTSCADESSRRCWLISTNADNNAFYNSHGFKTVGSYVLGDDNPSWKKKPVLVQFMVRQPESVTHAG